MTARDAEVQIRLSRLQDVRILAEVFASLNFRFALNVAWKTEAQSRQRIHRVGNVADIKTHAVRRTEFDGFVAVAFLPVDVQLQRVRLELGEEPDQETIAERLIEAEGLRGRFRSCDTIDDGTGRISSSRIRRCVSLGSEPAPIRLIGNEDRTAFPKSPSSTSSTGWK